MKTITLKISEELAAFLDNEAERRDISRSELVREAVAEYGLNEKRGQKTAANHVIGDLAGCLEGGPGDLATNKKYMKGFGE